MSLKLFISAVPATILGWMMWDLITLFEKSKQLQHENHIHKALLKEFEKDLKCMQARINDNRKYIDEVSRRKN